MWCSIFGIRISDGSSTIYWKPLFFSLRVIATQPWTECLPEPLYLIFRTILWARRVEPSITSICDQQGNQGRECMFAQDSSNSKRQSWTWKGSCWPPVQASSRGGRERASLRQLLGLWEGDLPHAVQGSHRAGDTSWGQLAVGLTVTQSLNIDQGSPTC